MPPVPARSVRPSTARRTSLAAARAAFPLPYPEPYPEPPAVPPAGPPAPRRLTLARPPATPDHPPAATTPHPAATTAPASPVFAREARAAGSPAPLAPASPAPAVPPETAAPAPAAPPAMAARPPVPPPRPARPASRALPPLPANAAVPTIHTSVADLLKLARHGLAEAAAATTPAERYAAAHLGALRGAAAVIAARAKPSPAPPGRRTRPVSAWVLLAAIAPELAEWAAFFAAGAAKRAAAEAGLPGAVTAREADDLLRDAETFLAVVETKLGGAARPSLLDRGVG